MCIRDSMNWLDFEINQNKCGQKRWKRTNRRLPVTFCIVQVKMLKHRFCCNFMCSIIWQANVLAQLQRPISCYRSTAVIFTPAEASRLWTWPAYCVVFVFVLPAFSNTKLLCDLSSTGARNVHKDFVQWCSMRELYLFMPTQMQVWCPAIVTELLTTLLL